MTKVYTDEEIATLDGERTPGVWRYSQEQNEGEVVRDAVLLPDGDPLALCDGDMAAGDARFVAACSVIVPQLRSELAAARSDVSTLRDMVLDACTLVEERHDLAEQLAAARRAANRTGVPVVHPLAQPAAFCFSADGTRYEGSELTREAAVYEAISALNLAEGATFRTGRSGPIDVSDHAWGETIVDDIAEQVSEYTDGNGDFSPLHEQVEDLDTAVRAAVRAWLDRHSIDPGIEGVDQIERHIVPRKLVSV